MCHTGSVIVEGTSFEGKLGFRADMSTKFQKEENVEDERNSCSEEHLH
jgi:hypothetical protein